MKSGMSKINFIKNLQNRHQEGLPGRLFQIKMSFSARIQFMDAPENARQSAVLALLFFENDALHILLMERSGQKNDPHSRQISFPGGSLDKTDKNLEACALRETFEEVGIASENIKIIGALTPLYIPVSNFQVNPFLAYTTESLNHFILSEEVNAVIKTPIVLLLNPQTTKREIMRVGPDKILLDTPYFDVFDHKVWGATAMMLAEILELVKGLN